MVGQSFQRTSLSNEAEKLAEMQGQHQASLSVSTEGDKTAIFVRESLVEPSIPIFLPEFLSESGKKQGLECLFVKMNFLTLAST